MTRHKLILNDVWMSPKLVFKFAPSRGDRGKNDCGSPGSCLPQPNRATWLYQAEMESGRPPADSPTHSVCSQSREYIRTPHWSIENPFTLSCYLGNRTCRRWGPQHVAKSFALSLFGFCTDISQCPSLILFFFFFFFLTFFFFRLPELLVMLQSRGQARFSCWSYSREALTLLTLLCRICDSSELILYTSGIYFKRYYTVDRWCCYRNISLAKFQNQYCTWSSFF